MYDESSSRFTLTLFISAIIFLILGLNFFIFKYRSYIQERARLMRTPVLVSSSTVRFVRLINVGLTIFTIVFLSRISPSSGADFGLTAFSYFTLLLGVLVFCCVPWERKTLGARRFVLILLFVLICILVRPVFLILKSFM